MLLREMTNEELIQYLGIAPGQKWRIMTNKHNFGGTKIHVLAIVEGMVVYRWYGKHKQWWHYYIESPFFLAAMKENKTLVKYKKSKKKEE